jgi:hypothetical protein
MAKRSRGTARPGQTRPTRRPARPGDRSGAAAGVDAQTATAAPPLDQAPAAGVAPSREKAPTQSPSAAKPRNAQASSLLTARAAQEYAYVARDVRHIAVVAGGLMIVLLVLYVLIEVLHVITI